MTLSPAFSDFPNSSGSNSGVSAASGFAHDRATAASMGLLPTIPTTEPNTTPSSQREPVKDRRAANRSGQPGRAGVERRQFGSSHSGLSAEGRDLASAIDAYKLKHHRRYITCDEMLVVLRSLGYEKPSTASE
ncbi:hypothetical protein FHS27_001117 [Rhodopirellula rubra]|uniref:Uncharacterized protein n=1 Tax=Aporhodopirellula rubra TaxID=980271 RepID=A0A7W5DW77_9BACT|nr:hypothetical protein [Aporhodopirellula rubra]MBB3205317.1 hypothetical protein [Aporhodopirellula rubra]